MKTSLRLVGFGFAVVLGFVRAPLSRAQPEPHHGSGPDEIVITSEWIDRLMEEARTNNPSLRAAAARVGAASAEVEAVRAWDDPSVTFGGSVFSSGGFDPAQEGNLEYGVEQKLPLWGRPKLNRRVAEAGMLARRAEADYRLRSIRRDIAKALLEAALAERIVEIGRQDQAWLEMTSGAVESKYRAGSAVLADSLQLENEVAERRNRLRTDRLNLAHSLFSLNRLLNRNANKPWPSIRLPVIGPAVPYSAKLIELSLRNEPQLAIMKEEIKQAEASANLVRRSRLPEVSVGVEGRQYTGDGGFRQGDFMLRLSIPWGNGGKYRKDYEREKEKQRSAEEERADRLLAAREELHHLVVHMDAARREALLYGEEISVRALQALSSRLADWESGRGMLREVLEARRSALDAQLMAARAATEQDEMLADLMLLTGLPSFESVARLANEPSILAHESHD
jgi:cobalt-zinc-cadmium efflux system outer membrane protein